MSNKPSDHLTEERFEQTVLSELFGHQKGSFTGAHQARKGKIEQAGTGTLFLDEVGELPFTVQGKFLSFLQRREYTRIGEGSSCNQNAGLWRRQTKIWLIW